MTTKEALLRAVDELPEQQVCTLLDLAEFLRTRISHEEWTTASAFSLAERYGSDEVEYSESDVRTEPAV